MFYGGTTETGSLKSSHIFVLNIERLYWSEVRVFGQDLASRYSHASVTNGDKIYIFGGCKGGRFIDSEILEIEVNQRLVRERMNSERIKEIEHKTPK